MSLIDRVRRETPVPEVTYWEPPPPSALDDLNPWARMAYHQGIDWARQQREKWGRPVEWRPPVDEWTRWCESHHLHVMRDLGWTPDPGGSAHLTQQQQDAGDGVSKGLTFATKQLYPRGHASPDVLAIARKYRNPPTSAERPPRHGPLHARP